MFLLRYFAKRFFPGRYFPGAGTAPVAGPIPSARIEMEGRPSIALLDALTSRVEMPSLDRPDVTLQARTNRVEFPPLESII